jgi:S1-C subfamily serine protease
MHVIEDYFIEFMVATVADNRTHCDAGRISISRKLIPFLPLASIRGTHERKNAVGFVRIGNPDLLAVNDIVLAIGFDFGLK